MKNKLTEHPSMEGLQDIFDTTRMKIARVGGVLHNIIALGGDTVAIGTNLIATTVRQIGKVVRAGRENKPYHPDISPATR